MPRPPHSPSDTPLYLIVGEVLRPHGVRGELRIRILTDYPDRLVVGKALTFGRDAYDPQGQVFIIEGLRTNKEYGLLKLHDIEDRAAADLLRELMVMVPLEEAVPLEDGEVYLYELIGMRVQTDEGEPLGEIVDIIETGANDVYVVRGGRYGEVLLPDIDECILTIDPDTNLMTVHLMDGLLSK